jgi:hypothetical protein
MVRDVVPDASQLDVAHVGAILDLDGNTQISLQEFTAALEEGSTIADEVGLFVGLH